MILIQCCTSGEREKTSIIERLVTLLSSSDFCDIREHTDTIQCKTKKWEFKSLKCSQILMTSRPIHTTQWSSSECKTIFFQNYCFNCKTIVLTAMNNSFGELVIHLSMQKITKKTVYGQRSQSLWPLHTRIENAASVPMISRALFGHCLLICSGCSHS